MVYLTHQCRTTLEGEHKESEYVDDGEEEKEDAANAKRVLVALAMAGVLDVILPFSIVLCSSKQRNMDIFHNQGRSYFRASLVDALTIGLIRGSMGVACVGLSFIQTSRDLFTYATAVVDAASIVILVVKAALFDWGRTTAYPTSVDASVIGVLLVMGLVELALLARPSILSRSKAEEGLERIESFGLEQRWRSWKATYEHPSNRLTARRLLTILSPYFWPQPTHPEWLANRVRCVSTWFFVAASMVVNIYSPVFLAKAADHLAVGDVTGVLINVGLYAFFDFASTFLTACQSLLYLEVKRVAFVEISRNSFGHVLDLSAHWHLKKKMGAVVRAMDRGNDAADVIVTNLFLSVVPTLAECAGVCIVFLVLFQAWALSVLLFTSLTVYGYVTIIVTLKRRELRVKTNLKDNELHEYATDCLINYETVKSFTNESFELGRYEHAARGYEKYYTSAQRSQSYLNILQQAIMSGCMAGSLILSSYMVLRGQMKIGSFLAVNAYVTKAFAPLSTLGTLYIQLIKAMVDMQNLNVLLMEKPDILDKPGASALPPPSQTKSLTVKFDNVCFHYPEQPSDTGLNRVSFEIPAGTTLAIVGSTGSGKTTISRLLLRYYDPIEGRVLMNGQNIRDVTQKSVRRLIGVVPQDTCLFNGTIRQNVQYGRLNASVEEVEAAAELAQLKPFIDRMPYKFETRVGERGLKLSGGEKQRVAIARCLLKDPPFVLLDEATSALDTRTEKSIQDALTRLRQNRTTLIIAHRLSTIKHADQIIVMERGRIVEKGSHEELLRLRGAYASMWELQDRKEEQEEAAAGNTNEGSMLGLSTP